LTLHLGEGKRGPKFYQISPALDDQNEGPEKDAGVIKETIENLVQGMPQLRKLQLGDYDRPRPTTIEDVWGLP